jgi:parallel beta-helix repeat protein
MLHDQKLRATATLRLISAFLVGLLLPGLATAAGVTVYVAPAGNDAWSGRLAAPNAAKTDGPLASLAKARDVVRRQKGDGPATVLIRAGVYCQPETLKFGPEDSGTATAPVVWRAYPGEKPVVMGARAIGGFTVERGQVLKADVAAQGFKGVYFRQLIFAGARQHLARWPNFDPQNPYGGGWTYADGEERPMYADVPDEERRTLRYKPADDRPWSRPEEGQVFIFARYNWWNDIVRIASRDRATRTIKLAGNCSYPVRAGDRYYVENLREELDAPGEWYLDRQTWTLYFWPPEPMAGRPVYAPVLKTIVQLDKTAHVTLRGLVIEGCEGTAVMLNNATECRVAGCTIRNVGDYRGSGVSVNGGHHNGVVGCDICNTGSNAVALAGGDVPTLTAAENYADNNYLHHVGVYYKQGVGVALRGVGNRASHNLIHDTPRMGIMFGGNNLVIEYNHIRHANLETEDTGAVYTGGRDWLGSRGTVIRYNYFHDILGYGRRDGKWVSPHFAWGVYLDDNTGGVDVIGNLIVRAYRAGIHLHNGRDNHVENNIFVDGRLYQIECNGWNREHRYWTNHFPTMVKGYESVAGKPAWAAMRNMQLHPRDAVLPDGTIMSGNEFRRNIICYSDPAAKMYGMRNFSLDHNQFDQNLVWHGGQPVTTGLMRVKRVTGPNLVENPGFEAGMAGKLPQPWHWQGRPRGAEAAPAAQAAEGKSCLRLTAGEGLDAKGGKQAAAILSNAVPLKPGQAYRLHARMKTDRPGAKTVLMVQSYVAKVYFWAKQTPVKADGQWKTYELVFHVPGVSEQGYRPEMKQMCVRIDFGEPGGTLWIDAVELREAEALDEWQSWQAAGEDQHSLLADPRFVAPAKDDYRLRPDSPAWKLGFQPLPLDKIGPYASELRASWPIVEAEGVREKPLH